MFMDGRTKISSCKLDIFVFTWTWNFRVVCFLLHIFFVSYCCYVILLLREEPYPLALISVTRVIPGMTDVAMCFPSDRLSSSAA